MPQPPGPATVIATQASALCDRLRRDLLEGWLKPGRKLPLKFLMERYQVGQTPVREALNRLASEGLVEFRDQRGFSVAGISSAELRELIRTRCWLEERALRESMRLRDLAWEEGVVLAWHRLSRTRHSISDVVFEANPEWDRLHRLFHQQLVSGCGSRWLVAYCEQQAALLFRYRQLSQRKAYPNRNVHAEHEGIVRAVIDGDVEGAVARLTAHFRATADVILTDPEVFGDAALREAPRAEFV